MAKKKGTFRQFIATYTEDQVDRFLEWPMIILTLFLIPIMAIPFLYQLSYFWERVLYVFDIAIWGAFYFEMFVKLLVSRNKLRTLKRNWFLVIILLMPSLRLFKLARVAKILRTIRLLRLQSRISALKEPPRKLIYNIEYGVLAFSSAIFIAAFLLWQAENRSGGAIQTFGDALWWSVITITTVGYGDTVPTSDAGRIVGAITAIFGIFVFMVITAKIVSYFVHYKVQETHEKSTTLLLKRLEELEKDDKTKKARKPKKKGKK